MSYKFVTVRTHEDSDGAMYPVFSAPDAPYTFETEPADGSNIVRFTAKGLRVRENGQKTSQALTLEDVKIDLFVTDSRVVACCEKYDKGGGWRGFGAGAVVALAANAVSMTMAAHRRKGKMLAGHVRYTWLSQVGGSTKSGFLDEEQLRLVVKPESKDRPSLWIDFVLPKSTDSIALAQTIARRCARYRLDCTPITESDERDEFLKLLEAPRVPSTKKTFGMQVMPRYYFVRPSTAVISDEDAASL